MTQTRTTVQILSSANSIDFERRSSISAQSRKLCSSISLITIGVLLILASLVLTSTLINCGIMVPALALLIIPALVGLILIALGVCELHTRYITLELRHLKQIPILQENKVEPKETSSPELFDTMLKVPSQPSVALDSQFLQKPDISAFSGDVSKQDKGETVSSGVPHIESTGTPKSSSRVSSHKGSRSELETKEKLALSSSKLDKNEGSTPVIIVPPGIKPEFYKKILRFEPEGHAGISSRLFKGKGRFTTSKAGNIVATSQTSED